MRSRSVLCLFLLCALVLWGCGGKSEPAPPETAATPVPTASPAPTAVPTATPAPTEVPTATPAPTEAPTATPAPTQAPTAAPAATPDSSYTLKLTGDVAIYQGPGHDYGYSQTVGQDGVYTIVEECYDEYGSLWGYLKSGAGWVNLGGTAAGKPETNPLTASFTDEALMNSGNYEYAILHESSYSMHVLLRAEGQVWDLTVAPYDYSSGNPVAQADIYQLHRMDAGSNLVLKLEFPGDMTSYRIAFTDGAYRRTYALALSGRDGSPWLWEATE